MIQEETVTHPKSRVEHLPNEHCKEVGCVPTRDLPYRDLSNWVGVWNDHMRAIGLSRFSFWGTPSGAYESTLHDGVSVLVDWESEQYRVGLYSESEPLSEKGFFMFGFNDLQATSAYLRLLFGVRD